MIWDIWIYSNLPDNTKWIFNATKLYMYICKYYIWYIMYIIENSCNSEVDKHHKILKGKIYK